MLSEGDIDLIIKGLDELPAQRSDIFGILAKHIGAYKTMIDENHVIRQAIYDDPLFSRLKEKETFEWLLDLAARERDQCADTRVQKTARMCEDFRDQLGKLFLILLAQTGVDPAFDSLVDSHAAEIMEAFQGASANEVKMARSQLLEDPDRESESDATKEFRAIRDDYALSTPAGGLSSNPAIDPKGVMGYGSKFHTACTAALTSPAEAVEAVRVALDSGVDVNSKNRDYTCLHIAVFHGISALVDFLLAAGAEVDAVAHEHTPLHFAAYAAPEENIVISHKKVPQLRNKRTKWVSELDRAYEAQQRHLVERVVEVRSPHSTITNVCSGS